MDGWMDDLSRSMNILWWKADSGTGGSRLWQCFEVRQEGKKTQGRGHDTANGSRRCWLTEEVVVQTLMRVNM